MRALVTNDDGIASEGLRRLAIVAAESGCEVVVAAPKQDSSGSSASVGAVASDGRIVVERKDLDGLPDVPAFAVSAAPSLITLIATHGAFGPRPDVVLSGINVGPNLGNAILHSGTVGAAMTGRAQGCRAMSVSLASDTRGVMCWDTAADVSRRVLDWLRHTDDEIVMNVNVPNVGAGELRGLRYGELIGFGSVQAMSIERGEGWVRTRIEDPATVAQPGSDAAQVDLGFASVTALRPLCTAHPPDVSALLEE
jgi:5'-nucleotidase